MKNIPRIRFKGFSGEWEEKSLGEVAAFTKGKGISKADVVVDGKNLCIRYGELYTTYGEIITTIHSRTNSNVDMIYSEDNDILMPTSDVTPNGLATASALSQKYIILGGDILIIRSQKIVNKFFSYFIQGHKSKVIKLVSGTTVFHLYAKDIENLYLHLSPLSEQTKIGNYFQHLDKLIEQKEKKYQKLGQFKKAMLSKMFPKNGDATPEIRFKGFSGEWEEKRFWDIIDRYDNIRVPISASNRIAGNTPYYGANGIQDYVQGFTHFGEFILVAEDGANDLKNYPVQYVNGKIWVNNHAHVLQAKKDIANNKFLKYAISKINIEPFLVGGGRAKLNANIMMNINLYVPNINEQTKIGNYFQKLDTQIELQLQEINKLKNIKKASLSKIFV